MSFVLHSHATPATRIARSAYTLVELLVVMAALTVLAAVTLPTLRTLLHDQKVTSASRSVLAHLQAAQGRAIAAGSPVSVIFERSADIPNSVSRLSIGQVFPPYEGDIAGATGVLSDSNGDGFIDRMSISNVGANAALLLVNNPPLFGPGDYLQLDDRQSTYVIGDITVASGVATVPFVNPAAGQEGDLLLSSRALNLQSRFRLYRKPTKSFLQTVTLPRGTCVDLGVSGLGTSGIQLSSTATAPAMIVFNPHGRIAYWDSGASGPLPATSLLHLLVGRSEQVTSTDPPEVAIPEDTSTFNANINDNGNSWLTVNPFTGAISSAGMQAGNEGSALAVRLPTARAFATHAITQNEN